MKWIKTVDIPGERMYVKQFRPVKTLTLVLCGNQQKWSVFCGFFCRLLLKIKSVLWARSSNEIG